jgi:hypothetical protein
MNAEQDLRHGAIATFLLLRVTAMTERLMG